MIVLTASPISPKHGQQLGTATATWNKIRQVTNGLGDDSDPESETRDSVYIEAAAEGAIFVVHPNALVIEVWDWDNDDLCLVNRVQLTAETNDPVTAVHILPDLDVVVARGSTLEIHRVFLNLDTTELVASTEVDNTVVVIKLGGPWIIAGDDCHTLHVFDHKLKEKNRFQTLINKIATPIFDIRGDWLAYSPAKAEHLRIKGAARLGLALGYSTPIKMPPHGPLLNRVLLLFSKLALDGLVALLKALLKQIKLLVNDGPPDYRAALISKLIGKLLYSTALLTVVSIQKTADARKPQDNQLVRVVHLVTGDTKAVFRPPGGVLAVLLLPYDLQLVTMAARGDIYYMWDLYRVPKEVSLVGKFTRGKTKAVVEDIVWFITKVGDSLNCGFGLRLVGLGTVHWFNINYFWGQINNRPIGPSNNTSFADAWIHPLEGTRRLIPLPHRNQLGMVTKSGALKVVSPVNGAYNYQYELPLTLSDSWQDFDGVVLDPAKQELRAKPEFVNANEAIAEAEINTCFAFLNLVNNDNVAFAVFDQPAPIWGSAELKVVKPFGMSPAKPAALLTDGVEVLGDVVIDPDLVEGLP